MWSSALLLVAAVAATAVVHAVEFHQYDRLSHDTLKLGERPHPHNHTRRVQGYAFLHLDERSDAARAQNRLPPPTAKSVHFRRSERAQLAGEAGGDGVALDAGCTAPISDGAVWRTARGYFINARNSQGLSAAFIERAVARAVRRWACVLESRTERLVIGPLLGVRSDRDGSAIRSDRPDGANEIGLATIDGRPGTVALTVLWGVFDGPAAERELTEFKMFFDQAHYRFGNATEQGAAVIDFEATATHEFGHAHGLDDIYESRCTGVTMFATSALGETNKRTLEGSDIAGVVDQYDFR